MAVTKNKSDSLNALLGAALALPSVVEAQTDTKPESASIAYNHTYYSESDDRMDVDIKQLSALVPIADNFSISANLIKDVTSGASPVLYLANTGEEPVMVLQAGASIKDTRDVYELGTSYYHDAFTLSGSVGQSKEDDYEADFLSLQYSHFLNTKNTILSASLGMSNDEAWNVYFSEDSDSFDPFLDPVDRNKRQSRELKLSWDQVITPKIRAQAALTYVHYDGDLSDPYKKVFIRNEALISAATTFQVLADNDPEALEQIIIDSGTEIDSDLRETFGIFDEIRPNEREQLIPLIRYSQYVETLDGALHLDYRYSSDDWGADSHTFEAQWRQSLPFGFILTPAVRLYTQDSADFYETVYVSKPEDNIYSSDYRLAGFGATSYQLSIEKTIIDRIFLQLHWENYQREFDGALSDESKGSDVDDYEFDLISFSFSYTF